MSERNEHHYPAVDNHAVDWGFYVTTLGRRLALPPKDGPRPVHPELYRFDNSPVAEDAVGIPSERESGRILPEFQVALITETRGVFESDETGIVRFDGPTLLFLFPGVWHRIRPVGFEKGWLTTHWMGFNGDIAYRLLRRGYVTPETAVRAASRPRRLVAAFDRLIDRVAADPAADPATDPVLLSMHAMDLLADCMEASRGGRPGKENQQEEEEMPADPLVSQMLDLIWTASHRGLRMDQLCTMAGVNRRTMERRFREARGHSLLTEVNLCRCHRARHLLATTALPAKNVCWLAGFASIEQMRVTFFDHVGMTPGQYRRKHIRERG